MRVKDIKKKIFSNLKNKWFRINLIISFICFILVFSMSIGYSILINNLNLDSDVLVEGNQLIKVVSIENLNTSCGYDNFNPNNTNTSVTISTVLLSLECSASYEIKIENLSPKMMDITGIFTDANNSDYIYEFQDINVGQIILSGETITTILTIKYNPSLLYLPSNVNYEATFEFAFAEHNENDSFIKISYNTTKWTNQDVTAVLNTSVDDISILNNNSKKEYIFQDNGTFTFIYLDSKGLEKTIEAKVDWIDKGSPNTFVPTISEISENSITLSGETEDNDSGILGYRYSNDNGATWTELTLNEYTFTNLIPDTAYSVKILAEDLAGNKTESYSIFVRTQVNEGENSTNLPIYIQPNSQGQYFVFGGFPSGITYVGDHWEGSTFTFVLAKPQTPPNNGQNSLSFTLPITNGSNYQWTVGQVEAIVSEGIFNKSSSSLSNTNVAVGASVDVTINVQAKIDTGIIDKIHITTSFLVNGIRKFIYIDFYWIPYNAYMLYYDNNNGDGNMPLKICISNIACTISTNTFTNSGYSFQGWSTTPNGPILYNNNAIISANTYAPLSKIGLYARWG